MTVVFQYPQDLLNLLRDAITLLYRSKKSVLLFFTSAGVDEALLSDLRKRVNQDRASISKAEIAEMVLIRLNQRGDTALRERRELVRRVTEFEDFSSCWPEDQLKARGAVVEIQRMVGVKDALTHSTRLGTRGGGEETRGRAGH